MEQHQDFEAHVQRALTDLERRLTAAQRRERQLIALFAAACVMVIASWNPLTGQEQKTVEERVADLEKRTGGFVIEGGATRITAPLEIRDQSGKLIALFTSQNGRGIAAIGHADEGFVSLGSSGDGNGFVRTFDTRRKGNASMGSRAGEPGSGFFIADTAGGIAAEMAIDGTGRPQLNIGGPEEGGVSARVDDTGDGAMTVRYAAGSVGVLAGKTGAFRMGLYANAEGGKGGVSVHGGPLGGSIRVHDPQGAAVGGLISGEEGGALLLKARGGGENVIDIGVEGQGGVVRVYSVGGGPARVALEADDKTGGVTTYSSEGKVAGTMTSRPGGSGYFQLLYNGITMVDAGMNEDGVGVVRAGPSSQKTVGVLSIPYRLVGRK